MKIIIPMSGAGERFSKAGYLDPKPLIKVRGKPIIEWVTEMFPSENDFTFICRKDHLQETEMLNILKKIKPDSEIIAIDPHKRGPVHALIQSFNSLDDETPCLISYCDYFMKWDYEDFKNKVLTSSYDGSVPCYTGFHPHLIPKKNLYAGCRIDSDKMLLEIREKFSFEQDKFQGHHSPGVYYFNSGRTLKHYCHKIVNENYNLNGEFYVSMIYELMLRDNKNIFVYDKIPFFCQWGTPEDLEDFNFWTKLISEKLV